MNEGKKVGNTWHDHTDNGKRQHRVGEVDDDKVGSQRFADLLDRLDFRENVFARLILIRDGFPLFQKGDLFLRDATLEQQVEVVDP